MKDVRLNLTENEKLAQNVVGLDSDAISFNMNERSIDKMLERERAAKFNSQVDQFMEKLEDNNKEFEKSVNEVGYDIEKAEIKPMFSRVIIKPFKQNPFQKIEMKGSLIVNAGGYTPHVQMNPVTGKYEEQKEFIVTGCVVEVGPETKYLREGDVVYYRKDTVVPVPFFGQGFVSLAENQVIAVVNEELTARFNNLK